MGRGSSKVSGGGTLSLVSGHEVSPDEASEFFDDDAWVSRLTRDEELELSGYTDSEYLYINRSLRAGHENYVKENTDLIDSAIAKFDLQEPIKVYRGSNDGFLGATSVDEINSKYVGRTVTDLAYMSTSLEKDTAAHFSNLAGRGGNTGMLFEITIPAGKGRGAYVEKITERSNEHEFITKRGSNMIVTGAWMGTNGIPTVGLQVVD